MSISSQMVTAFFLGFFSPILLVFITGIFISLKRGLHSSLDD